MAAFFVDLDGTIFYHGTNVLLPGAMDFLLEARRRGDTIVLTTQRGKEFEGHPVYDEDATIEALKSLSIPYDRILFDIPSPRVLINDAGAYGLTVTRDEGLLGVAASELAKSAVDAMVEKA